MQQDLRASRMTTWGTSLIRLERKITFIVPGEVRGQGRPRTQVVRDKDDQAYAHIHQSDKDAAYKFVVQSYASEAMRRKGYGHLAEPTPDGISVELLCYVRIPKSMPKKNVEKALRGEICPMRKPDLDNVLKAALDAMNSVVYKDDKDVTKTMVCRYYSDRPRLSVRVTWHEREEEEKAQ